VNFTEQQKYLKRSRVWSALAALITMVGAFFFWSSFRLTGRIPALIFVLVVVGITGSLIYTPDYLHLNVNLKKRARWQIKIRWRLIAVALITGILLAHGVHEDVTILAACAVFAGANFLAKAVVSPRHSSMYFWCTDYLILVALCLVTQIQFLVVIALLLAIAHLAIVTCEGRVPIWCGAVMTLSLLFVFAALLSLASETEGLARIDFIICAALVMIDTLATAVLVARAQRQNGKNVAAAIDDLKDFTGYSEEKIRELWATSNEQLAKNWKDAHLDESDREKMTAWYRENSELYMFAISGYNLEYKRIRDSIKMLRYGRGACLDYGAGNGEIILELARRGHAAIYFDVDGTSMRFARQRAERQKLAMEFFHSKDDLAASAQRRGLDTIFSFDVLEHLPDLPGELKFLASLLNRGGRMVFDVPAGSTKAHPMHLNHHLDVHAHMASIGMVEERGLLQSIPFRKQEKYVFRKPA
jgi:2-polyprenyl-3-methyl-5-hydroxy-6-metoxy-1,4-benzoquinol methylase